MYRSVIIRSYPRGDPWHSKRNAACNVTAEQTIVHSSRKKKNGENNGNYEWLYPPRARPYWERVLRHLVNVKMRAASAAKSDEPPRATEESLAFLQRVSDCTHALKSPRRCCAVCVCMHERIARQRINAANWFSQDRGAYCYYYRSTRIESLIAFCMLTGEVGEWQIISDNRLPRE